MTKEIDFSRNTKIICDKCKINKAIKILEFDNIVSYLCNRCSK